jgi:hypothetical protein
LPRAVAKQLCAPSHKSFWYWSLAILQHSLKSPIYPFDGHWQTPRIFAAAGDADIIRTEITSNKIRFAFFMAHLSFHQTALRTRLRHFIGELGMKTIQMQAMQFESKPHPMATNRTPDEDLIQPYESDQSFPNFGFLTS